jgi:hypothetical protein
MSDAPLARYYRDQAKRLREIGAQTNLLDSREELETLARQYELLADKIEKGATRPGGAEQP